jgi:hypothetical protein
MGVYRVSDRVYGYCSLYYTWATIARVSIARKLCTQPGKKVDGKGRRTPRVSYFTVRCVSVPGQMAPMAFRNMTKEAKATVVCAMATYLFSASSWIVSIPKAFFRRVASASETPEIADVGFCASSS